MILQLKLEHFCKKSIERFQLNREEGNKFHLHRELKKERSKEDSLSQFAKFFGKK